MSVGAADPDAATAGAGSPGAATSGSADPSPVGASSVGSSDDALGGSVAAKAAAAPAPLVGSGVGPDEPGAVQPGTAPGPDSVAVVQAAHRSASLGASGTTIAITT